MTACRALLLAALAALGSAGSLTAQQARPRFVNPPSLAAPRGYTHVVEVPAGSKLVYLSGQVPLDSTGTLVGAGDFRAQAEQVFANLRAGLGAACAGFDDVVKLTIYVLDTSQLPVLREVRDRFVNRSAPPASTLVQVRGLFRGDVLLEVEAVAAVPAGRRTGGRDCPSARQP